MKVFFYLVLVFGASTFSRAQAPEVYTNNFTTKLEEGGLALPRADSLKDLGVKVVFAESYLKYDFLRVELHCLYNGVEDTRLIYKEFFPGSNEFKVKYGDLAAHNFWILNPKGGPHFKGDFEDCRKFVDGTAKMNTLDLSSRYDGFYVVVKGFLKTGKKITEYDYYGNAIQKDEYDEGTALSTSISFNIRRKRLFGR